TVPRHVDAIKHEVKKYIKRERNKTLPDDADFWDFDCRFGDDEATSTEIHLSEISKKYQKLKLKTKNLSIWKFWLSRPIALKSLNNAIIR
ncbi:MAG: DUF6172 family protein, partial [Amphritea sp.]|nr:DUF6172 family protein [Amphritea sp.]